MTRTNKIIPVDHPEMGTMLRVMEEVWKLYREGDLNMVALSPHNQVRKYIRAVLNDIPEHMNWTKTGHYNLLIRYLEEEGIPRQYLDPKDCPKNITRIKAIMEEHGHSKLVSVVNSDEVDFFSQSFSEQGFDASTCYPRR